MTILPQPSARDAGVIAFTAHTVIFTDADPDWVQGPAPAGDLSPRRSAPRSCRLWRQRTDRHATAVDILLRRAGCPDPPAIELTADADPAHPRIARALRYRDDVRAWQADGGVVLLGRGVAGRWEVAIEVDPAVRGRGLGRALAAAARHLVPGGAPLWAQIAPGNAASVRAFLAAGFLPVGAESLLIAS